MNEVNQSLDNEDDQGGGDHRNHGQEQQQQTGRQLVQDDRHRNGQHGAAELYAKTWACSWHYWRQHPGLVLGVLGLSFVMTAADILAPWVAGWIVDAVTVERSVETAMWAVAAYVGSMMVFNLSKHATEQLWIRLAPKCMEQIVNDAFQRVQRFSADWHANSFSGAVVRKITRGKWGFDLYGDTLLWGVYPAAVILVGCTLMLLSQWWQVGLYVGVMGTIYVTVSILLATRWIGPANQKQVAQDSKISRMLAEDLGCRALVNAIAT